MAPTPDFNDGNHEYKNEGCVKISESPPLLDLVTHTAADYVDGRCARMGIIQRAECAATRVPQDQLIPKRNVTYDLTSEGIESERISSITGAELFALVQALGLAHRTIKRARETTHLDQATGYGIATASNFRIQRAVIYCYSQQTVDLIRHHIRHAPWRLSKVPNTDDGSHIRKIVAGVHRVSMYGVEVVFEAVDGTDKDAIVVLRRAWCKG